MRERLQEGEQKIWKKQHNKELRGEWLLLAEERQTDREKGRDFWWKGVTAAAHWSNESDRISCFWIPLISSQQMRQKSVLIGPVYHCFSMCVWMGGGVNECVGAAQARPAQSLFQGPEGGLFRQDNKCEAFFFSAPSLLWLNVFQSPFIPSPSFSPCLVSPSNLIKTEIICWWWNTVQFLCFLLMIIHTTKVLYHLSLLISCFKLVFLILKVVLNEFNCCWIL